ncbi:helix-turn-helix transcriptional regulator [Candidatus Saccharibacteria bacterium]|nr:helix-turn-helix transcriptional regulator [Candidatus Saccharibacteria bacterium]
MKRIYNQLPQVAFGILLALSLKERHGYEIIKQITEDSDGKIKLSPGALYTSIKQLNEQGLIKEVEHTEDIRRRYYRLTEAGKKVLGHEVAYYRTSVELARERRILEIGYGTTI